MDYILIALVCFLGFAWNVMREIKRLKKKLPMFTFKQIWGTFLNEEWDSFFISFLIFMCFEVTLFIVNYNNVKLPVWLDTWGKYVIPFIVQYAGQLFAYKLLNTTVGVLEKKLIDNQNQ